MFLKLFSKTKRKEDYRNVTQTPQILTLSVTGGCMCKGTRPTQTMKRGLYFYTYERLRAFGNRATINHVFKRSNYTVTGPLQFYTYKGRICGNWGTIGHDLTIFMKFLIVVGEHNIIMSVSKGILVICPTIP